MAEGGKKYTKQELETLAFRNAVVNKLANIDKKTKAKPKQKKRKLKGLIGFKGFGSKIA